MEGKKIKGVVRAVFHRPGNLLQLVKMAARWSGIVSQPSSVMLMSRTGAQEVLTFDSIEKPVVRVTHCCFLTSLYIFN